MTRATKIDPKKWYSLNDIVAGRMFPWVIWVGSVRNIIKRDLISKNHLRTTTTGTGNGTRYLVRGTRIKRFVKLVEAGKIQP